MKKKMLLIGILTLTNVSIYGACPSCGYHSNQPHYGSRSQNYQPSHSSEGRHHYNEMSSMNRHAFPGQSDQYITERDREILMEIHRSVKENNFDVHNNSVHFIVEYGKVIAKGRVNSEDEKNTLHDAISNIPNVKNVVMNVYVYDRASQNQNGHQQNQNQWQNGQNQNGWQDRQNQNGLMNGQNQNGWMNGQNQNGYDSQNRYQNGAQSSSGDLEKRVNDQIKGRWFAKSYDQVNVNVSNGTVTLSGFVETQEDKDNVENKVRNMSGVKNVQNNIQVRSSNGSRGQNQYQNNQHQNNQYRNNQFHQNQQRQSSY